MKTLSSYCESLLDADFDITDNDVILSNLCDWIETANKSQFKVALTSLQKILSTIPEVSPMKRAKLAETNTIISIVLDRSIGAKISIVYRGKKACYSHIIFTWYNGQGVGARISKGIHNMVEYKNKRKNVVCHCWALPPETFDEVYKYVPSV